jgi:cellulose synthase/poly-beta-1,6-N-acetylglucosamine synthase-like glycosyltransferase
MIDWIPWWSMACAMGLVTFAAIHAYPAAVIFWRSRNLTCEFGRSDARSMIVLCLRGNDPFLDKTLAAAAQLDYPNYFVRVIVDDETDPAHAVVTGVIKETGTNLIEVVPLRHHLETCSLKCSALIQALSDIPIDVEYVALLDADTEPHSQWLSQLVGPLVHDSTVAVTYGNRWFSPSRISVGAMTRYIWNLGAVPQMIAMRIPWGGTLAFRRSFVQQSDLLEKLGTSFCEDTTLNALASESKQVVRFVPDLMMVNRENCSLAELMPWIRRQLLGVRLHHPAWPFVFVTGIMHLLIWLAVICFALTCILAGAWSALVLVALTSTLMLTVMSCGVLIGEAMVRRGMRRTGRTVVPWLSPSAFIYGCVALCVLQIAYPITILGAAFTRRVSWRGIDYRIERDKSIRMIEYQPYAHVTSESAAGSIARTDGAHDAPVPAIAILSRTESIH